jgi:L-Ala-D/L-Glu epimerase
VNLQATQLDIYRTAIPMRAFEHAAAKRDLAEAIVVRVAMSDGAAGWGETLPRPYVTGETIESVAADLESAVWPAVAAADWADPRAALAGIPDAAADGRCMNAAACAAELACVDWLLGQARDGGGTLAALVGAAAGGGAEPHGTTGTGGTPVGPTGKMPVPPLAKRIAARVSGVLGSADPGRTARRLRLMRWFGLRDFKLKLGFGPAEDAENLRVVHRRIGKAVAAGRCTLRVDVNGAWDAASTPDRVAELAAFGVCAVEQPTFCGAEELVELARRCRLPLMADESLLTERDAQCLLAEPARVWWNVRISKNGGLCRSAGLVRLAGQHGVPVTVGCMVGESGVLSAAQRRLLQAAGPVRFVEGNYGRWLLADDLTRPSPRFGYGGRLKAPRRPGLGVAVDQEKLARYGRLVRSLRC